MQDTHLTGGFCARPRMQIDALHPYVWMFGFYWELDLPE